MQTEMPPTVAAKRDDRHRPVGSAGISKELTQNSVHAVGVTLECGSPPGTASGVISQLFTRGVKRRPDREVRTWMRLGHEANISCFRFGCKRFRRRGGGGPPPR